MTGPVDRRMGRRSSRRAPKEELERMLRLFRDKYADFTVKHFHEQLQRRQGYVLGRAMRRGIYSNTISDQSSCIVETPNRNSNPTSKRALASHHRTLPCPGQLRNPATSLTSSLWRWAPVLRKRFCRWVFAVACEMPNELAIAWTPLTLSTASRMRSSLAVNLNCLASASKGVRAVCCCHPNKHCRGGVRGRYTSGTLA